MKAQNLFGKLDTAALTPAEVLEAQAEYLTRATGGVLQGDVHSTRVRGKVSHAFIVNAPLLQQALEILEVEHVEDLPYPAVILPAPLTSDDLIDELGTKEVPANNYSVSTDIQERLRHYSLGAITSSKPFVRVRVANPLSSFSEFQDALREILSSAKVRGRLNSLIAKSRTMRADQSERGEAAKGSPDEASGD